MKREKDTMRDRETKDGEILMTHLCSRDRKRSIVLGADRICEELRRKRADTECVRLRLRAARYSAGRRESRTSRTDYWKEGDLRLPGGDAGSRCRFRGTSVPLDQEEKVAQKHSGTAIQRRSRQKIIQYSARTMVPNRPK